jgi:low temperature requirement protein LtrA
LAAGASLDARAAGAAPYHPADVNEAEQRTVAVETPRPWHIRMPGRDPAEPHRAVTPLELLFDLCFVVAVAQAAELFHHALVDGEVAYGIALFFFIFFIVWWPWVNFTWFASAYDTDDVLYRLLTFIQIAGVLVVAAGTPRVFEALDFRIVVTGYVIMRIAIVAQWLRAAREDPSRRQVALRFAVGVAAIQVLWVLRLAIGPPVGIVLIVVFGVVELLIPYLAERSGPPTPWHPRHISERYGLFTIIVLGECVFAATTAVQAAVDGGAPSLALISISLGGLLLVFAMWWAYFKPPAEILSLTDLRWQFAWGYGHFFLFWAVAALGAGLQVAVDAAADPEDVSAVIAGLAVAVPTAVYALAVAVLHRRGRAWREMAALGVAAVAALGIGALAGIIGVPLAVLGIGVVMAGVVGYHALGATRAASDHAPELAAQEAGGIETGS